MNLATLTKAQQASIQAHKEECLQRHYKSMEASTARYLRGRMSKTKAIAFTNKLNKIKGYECL